MAYLKRRFFLRFTGALLSTLAIALFFACPGRTEEPDVFAIKNARIIPVSSAPIEKGTVVIRGGIIDAVGVDAAIPADAWVIEGRNLVIYPGLIDAGSDIGLPGQPTPQTSVSGGRGAALAAAAAARPAEPASSLNAYVRAADNLTAGGKRAEDARAAGITTVLTVPDKGVFLGQSALVNLNGDKDTMLVRSPVAMHVRLSSAGGFREYPGSLMGVLAYVKQALLDARRYQEAWDVYNQNVRALRRPEHNRALEALLPVVQRKMPLVIPANTTPEIMRAVKLCDQNDVRYIISGGAEGWKVAATLKEKQIPVLVSLKFPEKEKDVHPEAEESLREMQRRADAPRNAAGLHRAGVQFAFFSDGLTNPRDFIRNAARAVKAGLPPDAALRAMTLSAAEILGAQEQLGSVEKGKIANLLITDGDLLAERTKIRHVFVDGKKFDAPLEESKPAEPAQLNLTGKWNATINTPHGLNSLTLDLSQSENVLTGSVSSTMGSGTITDGVVSAREFRFRLQWQMGERTMNASFSGTVEGDTIKGRASMPFGEMDFSGSRVP
jgi:imidazolonepropionase-like amidohydrolase